MSVPRQKLRVIGGQWRRRWLDFPDIEGLRPTPNRIRETLFNWLTPVIDESECLDLFAGSGALGIEALSRGAKQVTFVEQSAVAIEQIKKNCAKLNTKQAGFYHESAFSFLSNTHQLFDIVFIDPPFKQNLAEKVCDMLIKHSLLKDSAYIYLEVEKEYSLDKLVPTWQIIKEKTAGQVRYALLRPYSDPV
ncbi:MAG: 16S rRNA (guanine(966)-N(2))-methyltransferase RsmD [Pseudomonadota bacterium]